MSNSSSVQLFSIPEVYIQSVFLTFGVVGNFLIIFVTVINKRLYSVRALLLCILALGDLLQCIYLLRMRIFILLHVLYKSSLFCFEISIDGLFSYNLYAVICVLVAIDTLFSICWPINYYLIDRHIYLSILLVPGITIAILLTFQGYFFTSNSDIIPICWPSFFLKNAGKMIFWISQSTLAILTLLIFGLVQYKLWRIKNSRIHKNYYSKILVEVMLTSKIMVLLYAFTWGFYCFYKAFIELAGLKSHVIVAIDLLLRWLVIINDIANFPIYLWRCQEFRKTTIQVLTCKFWKSGSDFRNKTQSVSINRAVVNI